MPKYTSLYMHMTKYIVYRCDVYTIELVYICDQNFGNFQIHLGAPSLHPCNQQQHNIYSILCQLHRQHYCNEYWVLLNNISNSIASYHYYWFYISMRTENPGITVSITAPDKKGMFQMINQLFNWSSWPEPNRYIHSPTLEKRHVKSYLISLISTLRKFKHV